MVLLLLVAGAAYAEATGYTLPWWTTGGGGGDSTGGNYHLTGTIGQPDVGALAGGNCLQTVEATPQKDGFRYSVVNKFPIVHDGQPAMIGGIAVDITDYVQAREEKLQAEYALRLAIENSLPA